jgi:uncharacterized membrane protein
VLEVTVILLTWVERFPPHTIWLQVIWVIGICMIILGLTHQLPRWVLAMIGFALVFGHNLLSNIHFQPGESGYGIWTILHDRGYLIADGPTKLKVSYPLLPWIGVIYLGGWRARSSRRRWIRRGARASGRSWASHASRSSRSCAASTSTARRCPGRSSRTCCTR